MFSRQQRRMGVSNIIEAAIMMQRLGWKGMKWRLLVAQVDDSSWSCRITDPSCHLTALGLCVWGLLCLSGRYLYFDVDTSSFSYQSQNAVRHMRRELQVFFSVRL